ncbi:MAG: hypothetical protein K0R76_239 [Alphaproteobacteria bacterium]|jgi:hypothetical protein|nr:hypothetical protein [Alphaproteobacteria bacterium]
MRLINLYKFSIIVKLCFLSSILSISSSENGEEKEAEGNRLYSQRSMLPMENEAIITEAGPHTAFGEPSQLEAIQRENGNVVEVSPRPYQITETRNYQGEVVIISPSHYIEYREPLEATLKKDNDQQ